MAKQITKRASFNTKIKNGSIWDFSIYLDKFIEELQKIEKDAISKNYKHITIEFEAEDKYGSNSIDFNICGYREETDEEFETRKLETEKREKEQLEKERKLYKELKEKFKEE